MPDLSMRTRRKTKTRSSVQQTSPEPEPTTVSIPSFQKRIRMSGPPATRTSKRSAVLVGVSEPVSDKELTREQREKLTLRAHEDVKAVRKFLIERCGYRSEDICVMIDSDKDNIPDDCRPTKVNVLKHVDRMLRNPWAGDRYFFYFAGHGLQKPCLSGTESDGYDELIECEGGELIKDNELHDHLVKPLVHVPGCQLVALFDSCHAGTMLDLPHRTRNRITKVGWACIAIFHMQKRAVMTSQVATASPPSSRPSSPFQRPTSPFQRSASPMRSRHRPTIAVSIPPSISPITTQSPLSLASPSFVKGTHSRTRTAADITSSTLIPSATQASSDSVPIRIEIASARAKSSTLMMSPSQASPSVGVPLAVPSRGNSISPIIEDFPEGKCDGLCDPHQDVAVPRVISLGACADKEFSYESATINGGLMTSWFLDIMWASPETTYRDLMIGIRERCLQEYQQRLELIGRHEEAAILAQKPMPDYSDLKGKQSPQLSHLHYLNMSETIII